MREMKDSGIEWIGEIPESWEVSRIKQLFSEVNNRCANGENYTLLSVSEYYGVAPKSETISDDDMLTHAETLDGYKICKENDLVMNIMLAWKRALGVSKYTGIVSPAYCIYRGKQNMCAKYFHYLFRTDVYANLFKQYSTGIIDSRLRLYSDKFLSLKCQVPPIDTQYRIADYLDRKCSQIDFIIARQQEVIEKLKAYKLSVITEAVTKGLNPDVPMKDSGIDFIGSIPEAWRICRLRNIGTLQNGISKGGEFFGHGFPFVSYGDVYRNFSLPVQVAGLIDSSDDERRNYSVESGDIFFTRTSETIEEVGFSSVCEETIPDATFAGFLIRVRPFTDDLVPKFAKYYFRSNHHRYYLVKQMNLVTRASLGQDLLKSMPVLVPPKDEQISIAAFLDKKCGAIESSIEYKQRVIERLTAYKKSLIYEVVTGKKEV